MTLYSEKHTEHINGVLGKIQIFFMIRQMILQESLYFKGVNSRNTSGIFL
jgi:hypothetical protein